jgi:hypothetical protein
MVLGDKKKFRYNIDRLIKTGNCYGMEMNVENKSGNENLKGTIPSTDNGRSETTAECGIFQLLSQPDNK